MDGFHLAFADWLDGISSQDLDLWFWVYDFYGQENKNKRNMCSNKMVVVVVYSQCTNWFLGLIEKMSVKLK